MKWPKSVTHGGGARPGRPWRISIMAVPSRLLLLETGITGDGC